MNNLTPVSTIMKSFQDLFTVSPEDTLATIKEIFQENRFHHVPVINKHKLVGIISKMDLLKASLDAAEAGLILNDDTLKKIPVKRYMTEKMAKIGPKERVDVAALIFKENLFHCIPIVNEEHELLGLITPFDILTHSFKLTQQY
jgi:acetoin utilization protein AcuB